MTKKTALFLSLILLALSSILSPTNLPAEERSSIERLIPRLQPAVVLIQSEIGPVEVQVGPYHDVVNEVSRQTGTGFIIHPDGYIVTNGHVVQQYHEAGSDRGLTLKKRKRYLDILMAKYPKLRWIKGNKTKYKETLDLIDVKIQKRLSVTLSTGEPYTAEVKSYSPPMETSPGKEISSREEDRPSESGKDVAILKVEGRNFPVNKLGDSGQLRKGEPLYVFGYPGIVTQNNLLSEGTALDATVNPGSVSGMKMDNKGVPIIQTEAALSHGNSGSPAFNARGEVIGVATLASPSPRTGEIVQGFGYLVAANTVKEFVRTAGLPVEPESLFNRVWNQTLELYEQGKPEAALAKCGEALRLLPNQPDALRLQKTLQEQISAKGGSAPVPAKTALAGSAAVLLAGGGFFLFRRRRRPLLAPAPVAAPVAVPVAAPTPESFGALVARDSEGKKYLLGAAGVKIGRDPYKNQIVVGRDEVSREHAWVGVEGGKVLVKDLDSLNGTYLNSTDGERLKSAVLKSGDVIIIGKGKFASFTYNAT